MLYNIRKAFRKLRNKKQRQEWHREIDRLLVEKGL